MKTVLLVSFNEQNQGLLVHPILHHSVAGKHLPGSSIAGAGAEFGIDDGVLDILMPEPNFGKVDIFTGVQDVGADGMFEGIRPIPAAYSFCGHLTVTMSPNTVA